MTDIGAADPRIGREVARRWRIEALAGRGAFARVYRARSLSDGGLVAIKYLDDKVASLAEPLARFRREARVLETLSHPSIVRVLSSDEDDGLPCLVMEFVDGVTLQSALVQASAPFALERAARVIDALLDVLEAVHAQGIAHRDLKPENVMLLEAGTAAERIKVVDFGLAHVTEGFGGARLTMQGAIRGTPHYMSPEQCLGSTIGPAADIYAAACVLVALLTGAPPFEGVTGPEVMLQHAMHAPPRLADRVPAYASLPALESLVASSLAKQPVSRPDAAQFRAALRLAVDATSLASNAKSRP